MPDVNECTTSSTIHRHNCSDPKTCRNKVGGFYCKCQSGYRLDTTTMSCKRKEFAWTTILLGKFPSLFLDLMFPRSTYYNHLSESTMCVISNHHRLLGHSAWRCLYTTENEAPEGHQAPRTILRAKWWRHVDTTTLRSRAVKC